MNTTRGHIAVLDEGLTTKGKSQVTEEAGRGGGVVGRESPEVEAQVVTPTRSSAEEEQSLWPRTSAEAAGLREQRPRVKAGLEGLR